MGHRRFIKAGRRSPLLGILCSAALFLGALWLFCAGVDALSQSARGEELNAVYRAVSRAAVHCYALEGAYPEDLDYLEAHYGLSVDEDRFAVHYTCFASNIMPDIDVVPLR